MDDCIWSVGDMERCGRLREGGRMLCIVCWEREAVGSCGRLVKGTRRLCRDRGVAVVVRDIDIFIDVDTLART